MRFVVSEAGSGWGKPVQVAQEFPIALWIGRHEGGHAAFGAAADGVLVFPLTRPAAPQTSL